jgi:hypothetical protein
MPRKARQSLKARVDDKLDQALADTFPASDPVSFIQPAPVKPGDRKLIIVEGSGQVPTARSRGRSGGRSKATRF